MVAHLRAQPRLAAATLAALALGVLGVPGGCQAPPHPLDNATAMAVPRPGAPAAPFAQGPHHAEEPAIAPIALDEQATLADSLAYAAANSPALQAAFYRWRAAVERIPQARVLPDPMVGYGYFLNDFTARRGMEQHVFELSQTFPWFGKLRLSGDAAARMADAAAHEYEGVRLGLFLDVRRAWYELYQLQREIDLVGENLALVQQVEEIARARFRVGEAGHADLVRAQVELGRMEDQLRQLEQLRRPAAARLNAALGRGPDTVIAWPIQITDERLSGESAHLLAALARDNPRLRAMESEIEAERIETQLARREYYPDITLAGMYALRGEDAPLASISINVPIWHQRYAAGVREANARRLAAAYMRRDETNRLGFELHEALFEHDDAQRRIGLYRDTLLPKARESFQASLAAFQAGTAGFLDVLDAERTLLEFQISESRARTDRAVALARLDALIGQPVTRIPDQPSLAEPSDQPINDTPTETPLPEPQP
jgi:outer membrane protein, heavy metal efflux system